MPDTIPKFTQSHFEWIASNIAAGREHFISNNNHVNFAAEVAQDLAFTNPRFDRAKFIMACMPTYWVGTTKATAWEREARRA